LVSIQSISFFQQDQNYWQQAQAQSQAASADDALIDVMGQAETNLAKGLASIANGTALKRVNAELTAAVQAALQSSGSSTSSSSGSSTAASSSSTASGSSSSSNSSPSPASGTGTTPLTIGTTLSTLGILAGGTITVSAGPNLTTYTSTGTDTVGDLINAINIDLPTNAQVTASLNAEGELVITGRDDTDTIAVGGIYASNIGFGVGNNTFEPTRSSSSATPSASTSSTSSSNSSSSGTSGSSTSDSTSSSKTLPSLLALNKQNVSTAAGILSADGVSGTLVDMLA
jgi:peptidoglycan DL-endopeptidase CwlO